MAVVTVSAPTDWSSSASSAIASAVADAGPGGTVIFPEGTYRITQSIVPLAGQTLVGQGYESTVLKVDFSAVNNFPNLSVIRKEEPSGVLSNPNVTVRDLCIDGGRSQCGRPNPLSKTDPLGYGEDCPYGYVGGISLGIGWLVSHCRITNVNGPKTGTFGAHNARIEYCVWDNDDGGTGGVEDNIGGGGCIGLEIIGNTFKENCWGSGIDITTGGDIIVEDNTIGFRSLIMEGIQGGRIRRNKVYRSTTDAEAGSINIKSNAQYASAVQSGAWCSRDFLIEDNIVINSNVPGIVISSSWEDKGPGDPPDAEGKVMDAGKYGKARGMVVRNNWIVSPFGLGIWVGGQDRAVEKNHCRLDGNWVINPRQASGGLGNEWSSGLGYFKLGAIGIGSGDGVVVTNTTLLRTSASAPVPALVVQDGARSSSQVSKNAILGSNVYRNLVG